MKPTASTSPLAGPVPDQPRTVLVVDDSAADRARLMAMLGQLGYQTLGCASGQEALHMIEEHAVDIVVSDWEMPDGNGLELCIALTQKDAIERPYFLLLTGRDQSEDLVAGMDAGADDFLSKPVHKEELRVRVQAGARLQLQKENAALRQHMQTLTEAQESLRSSYRRVVQSERRKDELVRVMSHDFREPLLLIQSFAQLLPELIRDGELETLAQSADYILSSVTRMAELQEAMRRYFCFGTDGQILELEIRDLVEELLGGRFAPQLAGGAVVRVEGRAQLHGRHQDISQLLQNLIDNALRFTRAGVAPEVMIQMESVVDGIDLRVSDNGPGVPPQHRDAIFTLFTRLHGRDEFPGLGMGLAECRKITEDYDGSIVASASDAGGLQVQVRLLHRDDDGLVTVTPTVS